jgi:tetrahydromethanopterin S-methyltransferase subunit B
VSGSKLILRMASVKPAGAHSSILVDPSQEWEASATSRPGGDGVGLNAGFASLGSVVSMVVVGLHLLLLLALVQKINNSKRNLPRVGL